MIYLSELIHSCTDYNFISILVILKDFLSIMQLVMPIILLVSCIWGLIQMVINPDDKKGLISIRNKFIAAVICVFIPFLVNLTLLLTENTFSISSCWQTAKEYKLQLDATEAYDVATVTEAKKNFIGKEEDYYFHGGSGDDGDSSSNNNESSSNPGGYNTGNAKGDEIVKYALSFVGKPYIYGGGHGFNGTLEELYASGSAPDCSSFVRLVYKHFGYNISETTFTQENDGVGVSYDQAQAGDLIVYNGHVAIFIGNGDMIVHAANEIEGVKVGNTALYDTIKTVRRII